MECFYVRLFYKSSENFFNRMKHVVVTWKMEAPYGVRHALRRLSLPVDTNHLPVAANFRDKTHDS